MSRIISLLAALAMTASLAACASDDSEGATSDGTESVTTVVDDAAAEGADADSEMAEEDAASDGEMTEDHSDSLAITGEVTFTDATVEAGSILVLTLTDLTDANAATALVTEEQIEIEDGTSPIPFTLSVPLAEVDPALRYSLRAQITDASGAALLTTNSANSVDVTGNSADLGSLALVSAD